MGPKKKGGKKKKKSGKKSGSKKSDIDVDVSEVMIELNKEYFILHIQDLERRVTRYQKKHDLLYGQNEDYVSKFDEVSKDKRIQVSNLKKALENRGDELADLGDMLTALNQARETQKDASEMELQRLRAEYQEVKDQLTSENNILTAKLAALEEFRSNKDAMWQQYYDLVDSLTAMKEKHSADMNRIEQKTHTDRDRLKKEMVARVNQVAAEFRKVSNQQMADTTKRTIRENVSIQTQLSKMADKRAELVQGQEDMKKKIREQAAQIRKIEEKNTQLAKKNSSNQKILNMLEMRRMEQLELLEEYTIRDKMHEDRGETIDQLIQEADNLTAEIEMVSKDTEELNDMDQTLTEQKQGIALEVESAKQNLAQAARALRDLLQEVIPMPVLEEDPAEVLKAEQLLKQQQLFPGSNRGSIKPPTVASSKVQSGESDMEPVIRNLLNILKTNEDGDIDTESLISYGDTSEISASKQHKISDIRCLGGQWTIPGGPANKSKSSAKPLNLRKQSLPPSMLPPTLPPSAATDAFRAEAGYCMPGSLQLVPPWGSHIPTQLEKSKIAASKTRSQRHIESYDDSHAKSVALQTASVPRAVFCADRLVSSELH